MAFHLSMHEEQLARNGRSPEEARRQAALAFGARTRFAEESVENAWATIVDEIRQDVVYALRSLRRSKGFALTAAASLALGLAAITMMYSFVDCILLRPLPYAEAERVVLVRTRIRELAEQYSSTPANASLYAAWSERCRSCELVAALRPTVVTLSSDAGPKRLDALAITPNTLPLLKLPMRAGRWFDGSDASTVTASTVIVSESFALRRFGTSAGSIEKRLVLDGRAVTIVGVLAREALLPSGNQLGALVPLPLNPDVLVPLRFGLNEIAAPGGFDFAVLVKARSVSSAQNVQEELEGITSTLPAARRGNLSISVTTIPLIDSIIGPERQALGFELSAVVLLLTLICVNLGCLFLARSDQKQREFAVRQALGAGRLRLGRLAVIEMLLLTVVGALGGLALALIGLPMLVRAAPEGIPRLNEVQLDLRIAGIVCLSAMLVGFLSATIPGMLAYASDPADALRSGGRGLTGSRAARPWRRGLLGAQGTLCAGLLVLTALFSFSYLNLLSVPTEFETSRMLVVDVAAPARYSSAAARAQIFSLAKEKLSLVPGVIAVSIASRLPLDGELDVNSVARVSDDRAPLTLPLANVRYVTGDYFATMGMSLRQGVSFRDGDAERHTVVLSRRAATAVFGSEDAVGRELLVGDDTASSRVVGVVADTRASRLDEPAVPMVYRPLAEGVRDVVSIVVRSGSAEMPAWPAIQSALSQADADMAVIRSRRGAELVTATLARRRFELVLIGIFAAAALVAGAIGTYGVMSHALSRRASELGIRRAIGADRRSLYRLVITQELFPYGFGIILGVVLAGLVAIQVRPLLFQVGAFDPMSIGVVVILMSSVGLAACLLPTRRIVLVTGFRALRVE